MNRYIVYKFVEPKVWEMFLFSGQTRYSGSTEDNKGYIKLCTKDQIPSVLEKYRDYSFVFKQNSLNMPPTIMKLTVQLDSYQFYTWSLNSKNILTPRLYGTINDNNLIDVKKISLF